MTRDEILNMPAGNELDALVAELVFGIEIGKTLNGVWVVNPEYKDIFGKPQDTAVGWRAKTYSTDISAAWEVVEKFHNDYSILLDYDDPETIEELKWCCSLLGKGEPYQEYEARADTAPLAICRAALLAVMEAQ